MGLWGGSQWHAPMSIGTLASASPKEATTEYPQLWTPSVPILQDGEQYIWMFTSIRYSIDGDAAASFRAATSH